MAGDAFQPATGADSTLAPSFLDAAQSHRLILFGGKGGVGKTTCAAAAGVSLALRNPAERFLLVSVDPAHSLLDCLAGDAPPANLEVLELDAHAGLADFKARHGSTLKEIARRGTFLDEEDIERFVDLSLPGLDELIAFLHIADWLKQATYQAIVVDTAPSGHTLRLLSMPALMRSFLGALDTLLAKYRYMKRLFRGTYKPDAADQLLLDLTQATKRTQALLRSPQSCFVPVFLAERLGLQETGRLLAELDELGVRVGPLIANRLVPAGGCTRCNQMRDEQRRTLKRHGGTMLGGKQAWALPLLPAEVRGISALAALWPSASRLETLLPDAPPQAATVQLRVVDPAPPPPPVSVLLFAGKGGVGKTTLSCAAALRLSSPPHGRQVVLLSTDPAHSIGHCLEIAIGSQPTEVAPGLSVIAPDAAAEWRDWQHRYKDELEAMLGDALGSLDLTFDRQVMEQLFDLCPPGLDEIMALTRITELLDEKPDALLIIDTAPTGHLLRLLEMPELLESWLKAFFQILLKYRKVLRMPRLSDQLIALSKRLKTLRKLLLDPTRVRLCAVAIPTELSHAETADLLAACQRMNLYVERLFINQCSWQCVDTLSSHPAESSLGPAQEERGTTKHCPLCVAIGSRESAVAARLRRINPALGVSVVERGDPPVGRAAVATLGTQLFQRKGDHARVA